MPAGSYTITDPKLARDPAGEYHLQKGSPAIDAAKGSYAAVTMDMDAQARTGKPDVGADEFSTAPVKAKVLDPSDVGAGR
jgi:hypothetical protein